jgi:hypothetical protein
LRSQSWICRAMLRTCWTRRRSSKRSGRTQNLETVPFAAQKGLCWDMLLGPS